MLRKRAAVGVLLSVWILVFLMGCSGEGNSSEQNAVLTFIHVGKGDAFLLYVPSDGYYMIDTGKKKDFGEIQEVLEEKQVTRLQGIFLTHGHKDHAGGLEQLLEAYPTEKLYVSALPDPSYQSVDVRALAQERQVSVEELSPGDVRTLGSEENPVQVQVLGPSQTDEVNENNNSLILRVVYGETAYLLMGDAELESEERLLASGQDLQANVLKLGHHGELDATSEALLQAVSPSYGIVTSNREKNADAADPAMEERLREAGVQVYYSEGKVRGVDFISDGREVSVKRY